MHRHWIVSTLLLLCFGILSPATAGDPIINADGDYVITTGPGQSYTLESSYAGIADPVTVTATLGAQITPGSGADGHFSITLPNPGDWEITIDGPDGTGAAFGTEWHVDDQPPALSIDGADTRTSAESTIRITGLATDAQSALAGVSITTDHYSGTSFGTVIGGFGTFSGEVPLKVGDNLLTVTAADIHNNTTIQTLTVTHTLTALPMIQITSPANGAVTTLSPVDVSGFVRSTLPPGQIRMVLGDRIIFAQGSDNEYNFTFTEVHLVEGANIITVRGETTYGNVNAQSTVQYISATTAEQAARPRIEVFAPLPGTYLTGDTVVTGVARSELGVKAVHVNGQPVEATGLGSGNVSFQSGLQFDEGQQSATITITATDMAGQTGEPVSYTVYQDGTPPAIALNNSIQSPVTTTTQSPYTISGSITETNLAGATINGQAITLAPSAQADTFSFSATVPLTYGQAQPIEVSAWDFAGNRSATVWNVELSSNLTIEVISPADGAQLQGQGDSIQVPVTVRIAGAQADDSFTVALDGNPAQALTRAGSVGNLTISVPTTQAGHRLTVRAHNSGGTELSSTGISFSVVNTATVALTVERIKPDNGASGIEPNGFIALYFSKPIDPAQLTIEVLETVHGQSYAAVESGADLTRMSKTELIEVHRDREVVPGGIAHFPDNRMAAFYPDRDLAYGADIFISATYDGEDILRSTYQVRPLPTFAEGFVLDSSSNSLPGIEVEIVELGMRTKTDSNGAYGFGYHLPASQALPEGRYTLAINRRRQKRDYGTLDYWLKIRPGRINEIAPAKLPCLFSNISFQPLFSGRADNVLAGGALTLDLTAATLTFSDLRDQGVAHVQVLPFESIPYPNLQQIVPHWVFCLQPGGVQVRGQVALEMEVPTRNGSHAYLDDYGDLAVLVGLDPDAYMLVPAGVGRIDKQQYKFKTEGPVELQRLDYIGFAFINKEAQPLLERYIAGEINLPQLIAELTTMNLE